MYDAYEPKNARYLNLHRGHLMFSRPEEMPYITEDLILGSTFTGTREVLVQHLDKLQKAGFKQFTIQIVEGHEDAIEDWAEVFKEVGDLN